MGSFGPARCAILSAGRNGSGLRGMFRRWIWKTDSVVILIGFIRKATCAITSAKQLKFCATKELFIASPRYDSGGTYSVAYKARRSGPGDWCRLLDHCDKEALIEKYQRHGIAVENIEEVDFVWDGRPYTELIGRRHIYDWIIASHVLERTTDLIGFLNDCDSLLKKAGVLSLAVPDKRYCFDHFRPITGNGRVIDA